MLAVLGHCLSILLDADVLAPLDVPDSFFPECAHGIQRLHAKQNSDVLADHVFGWVPEQIGDRLVHIQHFAVGIRQDDAIEGMITGSFCQLVAVPGLVAFDGNVGYLVRAGERPARRGQDHGFHDLAQHLGSAPLLGDEGARLARRDHIQHGANHFRLAIGRIKLEHPHADNAAAAGKDRFIHQLVCLDPLEVNDVAGRVPDRRRLADDDRHQIDQMFAHRVTLSAEHTVSRSRLPEHA